jgi:hypothetical protein
MRYLLGNNGGRCVVLPNLPPLFADCIDIWEPQTPGNLWAFNRPVQGFLRIYVSRIMHNYKANSSFSC